MVSAARKIAFETLRRVEAEGAYASEVLHAELGKGISTADAALATELTLGVLRQRGLLDFLLERLLKKPVGGLDLAVVLALRMGLYQLRFLRRIPARAAVNESVELVKRARKASAAALVNAVLRRAAGEVEQAAETFLAPDAPPSKRLSVLHSHPQWMVERWLAAFGETRTLPLLEANNRAPRVGITLRDPSRRDEVVRDLTAEGLEVEDAQLLNTALRVKGGSVARSAAFLEGRISIQDEASQAIPFLLQVEAGHHVLDLCAAPGGKTSALARAACPGGLVVAADLHGHRLRAMSAQLERAGSQNVTLVQLDASKALPFAARFDRILADVPCSGTGTLARHPEIRWRLRPEQMNAFHELQVAILNGASDFLTTGGRLVYSTCSLETEENERVVAEALARNRSLRRVPATETESLLKPHLVPRARAASLVDEAGYFRTVPGEQRTDGFFAAVLEKNRSEAERI